MITKIEIWRTDDNKDFDSEVEALRHENDLLRQQIEKVNKYQEMPVYRPQPFDTDFFTTGIAPALKRPRLSGWITPTFSSRTDDYEEVSSPDPFMFGGSDFGSGVDLNFNPQCAYSD